MPTAKLRVVLLGPNGQLGYDIQQVHEDTGGPFQLIPVGRDRLDIGLPGMEETLRGWDFDVLLNCTGYHRTDEVEDNAALAFAVNAHAVQGLAQECERKGAWLIHISTDYVFGGDVSRETPLREDDPTAPINVYGASKELGETLARLALDRLVILRVASLFGVAGASGKGGNFVETIIRRGKERGSLRVVDDQVMSPTSTADVAQIVIRMLMEGCVPGVHHVVNSGTATWFRFAEEIIRLTGIDASVSPCTSDEFPTRAARPRFSALDNSKVSTRFDRLPPWQEALERYLHAKGHPSGV